MESTSNEQQLFSVGDFEILPVCSRIERRCVGVAKCQWNRFITHVVYIFTRYFAKLCVLTRSADQGKFYKWPLRCQRYFRLEVLNMRRFVGQALKTRVGPETVLRVLDLPVALAVLPEKRIVRAVCIIDQGQNTLRTCSFTKKKT